jgi:hypothetical protein
MINGNWVTLKSALVSFGQMIISALITFLASRYWVLRSIRQKNEERMTEVEKQLALVKQSITPISAAFQAILIKELTHFHTPVMDALMVKVGPPYTLTDVEEKELIAALEVRMQEVGSLITESERDAAAMLPMVIKRVKAELAMGVSAPLSTLKE